MKKEDLKYGNVVETREGHRYIKIEDTRSLLRGLTEKYSLIDNAIREDLSNENPNLDIMKVYEDYTCSKVLWERPKDKPEFMFKKEELIYSLLCTYHTLYLHSIDSEIEGMTKVIKYKFDEREIVEFEVSADDYDKLLEIIKCIEKGEIEE